MFLWRDAGLFSVLKDELIIQLKKLTQSIIAIALDNETALIDNMQLKLANVKAFRDSMHSVLHLIQVLFAMMC